MKLKKKKKKLENHENIFRKSLKNWWIPGTDLRPDFHERRTTKSVVKATKITASAQDMLQ